ncbi:hypothetical protein [Ferrimonas pelagia]|uniref:Uncharacterized protein n=1 Tax=Ferrimonas pelagia TaxID=1177826 RepID=A0ABP9EWW1_9GAMM
MHHSRSIQGEQPAYPFSESYSSAQSKSSDSGSEQQGCSIIAMLRREAKRLHRAATSGSLARSLPVLRRLLASEILRDISLVELRKGNLVQRKHLLQLLAREAGFSDWAAYRRALARANSDELAHYAIALRQTGSLNLWFSTLTEANAYVEIHGGRAIAIGLQAVVIGA